MSSFALPIGNRYPLPVGKLDSVVCRTSFTAKLLSDKQRVKLDTFLGLPGFEWVKIDEKLGKINVLGGRKQEF